LAFFKRKASIKEEIKSDDEIQSLLDAALEPVEKVSQKSIADKTEFESLEDFEASMYEDLLKSADLPTLSEEDILQAEKEDEIAREKIAQIKANFAVPKVDAQKDDTLNLEIPQPEEDVSETTSILSVKETVEETTKPLSLEEKIDSQLLKGSIASKFRHKVDAGAVRVDVARISADIQSGEELYRRAQMRIESLTQFVERAEIDTAILKKLEPENRNLRLTNEKISKELDKKQREISILKSDLIDHRKRLKSRDEAAEQSNVRLAKASKSLHDYELALKSAHKTSDQNYIKLERNETALDVERRENKLLQEKIKSLSTTLDDKSIKLLEAEKLSESLKEDCAVLKTQTAKLEDNNSGFRNALDEAVKQNNLMKGKLISLHEDIRNFKTQSEYNLSAREERILTLENQIVELTRQVEIKDEILFNTARDVSDLRKARSAYGQERNRLEQHIDSLSQQLADAQNKLLRVGKDTANFDKRYHDVAEAITRAQANRPVKNGVSLPVVEKNDAAAASSVTNVISEKEIANKILTYKRDMGNDAS